MSKKKVIAITGGIGSGKSIVSAVLRIMGFSVYDCDKEAKRLMNTSNEIKRELVNSFGYKVLTDVGTINSVYLASIVFKNETALRKLNSIVHPCVKEDILLKLDSCSSSIFFIETAILLQSNLLDITDEVWLICANEETRIDRVIKRNGITADDVKKRIQAQQNQDYTQIPNLKLIFNEEDVALLPQVQKKVIECLLKCQIV